jgi:hypothetical protein
VSKDEKARKAILARRARFMAAALAATGCKESRDELPPGVCLSPPMDHSRKVFVPAPDAGVGAGNDELDKAPPQVCLSVVAPPPPDGANLVAPPPQPPSFADDASPDAGTPKRKRR